MTRLLHAAGPDDLDALLPLVRAFHDQGGIRMDDDRRRAALAPLLADPGLGRVYLIGPRRAPAGYMAVTFGWSIELGGRDAFIDEFYIRPAVRGRGMGSQALISLPELLAGDAVQALHLEIGNDNAAAEALYTRLGFMARSKYHLMTRMLVRA